MPVKGTYYDKKGDSRLIGVETDKNMQKIQEEEISEEESEDRKISHLEEDNQEAEEEAKLKRDENQAENEDLNHQIEEIEKYICEDSDRQLGRENNLKSELKEKIRLVKGMKILFLGKSDSSLPTSYMKCIPSISLLW